MFNPWNMSSQGQPLNADAIANALIQRQALQKNQANSQPQNMMARTNTTMVQPNQAQGYISPDELDAREKSIRAAYANAINPQGQESSWTQGAARMLASFVAGKQEESLKAERAQQEQQRAAQMQAIGQALSGGGDLSPMLGQTQDPALQELMIKSIQNDKARKLEMQERKADRDYQIQSQKEMIDYKNQSDPIKSQQQSLAQQVKIANDPNATPEAREQAKLSIAQSQQAIAAMSPARTTVNVDTGTKADQMADIEEKKIQAQNAVKDANEAKQLGIKAQDDIYMLKEIDDLIGGGDVTNANITPTGEAWNKTLAKLGIKNDSAAIGNLKRAINTQILATRQQLRGQGAVSNMEGQQAGKTAENEEDTIEALKSKIFVSKQMKQRLADLGNLTNEWEKRYGSTRKPDEKGRTFYDIKNKLIEKRPIVSYEDYLKKQAAEASKNNKAAQ